MKIPSTGLEEFPTGISGREEVLDGGVPKARTTLASAVTSAGGLVHASRVAERLLTVAKAEGITTVYTCLPQQVDSAVETEPLPVVAVIDTWIHLSNVVEAGERSRTLPIIKSRGTFAASTMREIIRTPEGIVLRKVYVRDQRVLTGQHRLEEEARHRAQIALWQREIEVMSAQLVADKLALESMNGEHPQSLTGDTRPGKVPAPKEQTRTSRKRVSEPRSRPRRKGVPA